MSYLGSKAASGVFQAIIALMPPHDVYIETHLGSGAVMRAKPPCKRSIGIDVNPSTIDAFDYVGSVELITGDCLSSIDNFDYAAAGMVLIYADPPYLHSTRGKARYEYEYTDADHVRLIESLRRVPASVILSGYPSKLYDDLLSDWQSIELQAMTRGGVRTEKIWFNFNPDRAFWATYAGKDFTERQRIKRKASRWAASYRKLPAAERLAIFAALMQSHSQE